MLLLTKYPFFLNGCSPNEKVADASFLFLSLRVPIEADNFSKPIPDL